MRNVKKITALFLSTVMTLSVAACAGGKDVTERDDYNGGKEVEISYWDSGMGTDYIDAMCKAFNEKQDEWYVYYNPTSASGSVTATYPLPEDDNIDLYMSGVINDTSYMATLDDVLDSTADGDTKTIREKFDASHLESEVASDGHYYSLTWGGGSLGIIYNKKLFERAGIEVTPRTTDELAVVCAKLADDGTTPLTHYMDEAGNTYWDYMEEVWHAQYDGFDYYRNKFYECEDEEGNSPSLEVLTKKDGRYQVLKAMEKFLTPDNILPGSNDQSHVKMQSKFFNQDIGMMVNGSWISSEMSKGGSETRNMDDCGMMKTPVISAITDKLTTVKSDTQLRQLIDAIDSVTDGVTDISEYQSGDGYVVKGKEISAADWDTVKTARNMVAVNYPQQTCFIPSYSDAIEGAKEFLRFYYSDAGQQIFMEHLHYTLPLELSQGEINRDGWSELEKEIDSIFQNSEVSITQYMKSRHDIFINGGAKPYAGYNFALYFCVSNPNDRVTADEAWDAIVKKFEGSYESWLLNIK